MQSLLSGIYQTIDLSEELPSDLPPLGSLCLGIPTMKQLDTIQGLPIDRLTKAMSGTSWGVLILSEPVEQATIKQLRNSIMNEIRSIEALSAQNIDVQLSKLYSEILQAKLNDLMFSLSIGSWRTAVYLLGSEESIEKLGAAWRAIFSGSESLSEPIFIFRQASVGTLSSTWSMPNISKKKGPGYYHHPYEFQTLLTSKQLAAYVHFPNAETGGFKISEVPYFDVVPSLQGKDGIHLGHILQNMRKTEADYVIRPKSLSRHVLIAGITGSGKTNTIFNIIAELTKSDYPFLVIEPSKSEYRALLNDPKLKDKLAVFTLANEDISPFRLNPFEVPPGIRIQEHIDLLRSVFTVSFGMWTPLPQVLERCLYEIYADKGWNISSNLNYRNLEKNEDNSAMYPTLTDLFNKVEQIVAQLGYEDKVADDIRAALKTRINSLRIGGKGRMLDVRNSLPVDIWLEKPTILELEGMVDDDDKAFIMGLILIRLVEHRRAKKQSSDFRHLLIIEEAHRLLTAVSPRAEETESNPRGKAVESFSNLLSEIRAYGQGVLVADQVPVRLAPDVIKNTNLKIAHRVVAEDDRKTLAATMSMYDIQTQSLTTLGTGIAAVHSEGDDVPILVQMDLLKDRADLKAPDNAFVAKYMKEYGPLVAYRNLFLPHLSLAGIEAKDISRSWELARTITENPSFRREFVRFIMSLAEYDGPEGRLWSELLGKINSFVQSNSPVPLLSRCLIATASEWFVERQGSQAAWSYSDTARISNELQELLLALLEGKSITSLINVFRKSFHQLHIRQFEPFYGCGRICSQKEPLCLYRHAIQDLLISNRELKEEWDEAQTTYSTENEKDYQEWLNRAVGACSHAAKQIIEYDVSSPQAFKRVGLCFAQHMLSTQLLDIHKSKLNNLLYALDMDGTETKE
jgi:hypothetical protein